jgi:hypothetical protein
MKNRNFFIVAPLVPLLAVIVLAIFGITLNHWVYVILALVCLLAAATVWFI